MTDDENMKIQQMLIITTRLLRHDIKIIAALAGALMVNISAALDCCAAYFAGDVNDLALFFGCMSTVAACSLLPPLRKYAKAIKAEYEMRRCLLTIKRMKG